MDFDLETFLRDFPATVHLEDAADIAEKKSKGDDVNGYIALTAAMALRCIGETMPGWKCNPLELRQAQWEGLGFVQDMVTTFPEDQEPLRDAIVAAVAESAACGIVVPELARMPIAEGEDRDEVLSDSIDNIAARLRVLIVRKMEEEAHPAS